MQPYSREAEMMRYSGTGPDVTRAPRTITVPHSRNNSLPQKRTGLEPPTSEDEEEERLGKKPRLEDPAMIATTNASILRSQVSPLNSRPFGGLPDAALARFLAETQHTQYGRRLYPGPGLGPPLLGAGFDPLVGMHPQMVGFHQSGMMMGPMGYPQAPRALPATSMTQVNNPFLRNATMMMQDRPANNRLLPLISQQRRSSTAGLKPPMASNSLTIGRDDDHHAHFSRRVCIELAIEEDPNWLSELQSFVRGELLEVCWASREDVAVRNASKKVSLDQVGIRCRYCAHKPPGSRAQRSSAFPSSIPQLYQSFTMMLRDHFDSCTCIPTEVMEQYLSFKSSTCQGATEAKKYWSYSAAKLGMVDTEEGIVMNDDTRAAAKLMSSFGAVLGENPILTAPGGGPILLIEPSDKITVSSFLYTLMSHYQKIELLQSERKGNRKSLKAGLPGFGCRHCSSAGRFGMSRVFPARRRTLPVRVADMFNHICRCNLCPPEAKLVLKQLRDSEGHDNNNQEKKFLDAVWDRLGHHQANP